MRLIDADDMKKHIEGNNNNGIKTIMEWIDNQPTIEPQRMRGRWIEDGYNDEKAVCDQCGEPCATYIMGEPRDKYCKWCGADMRRTE